MSKELYEKLYLVMNESEGLEKDMTVGEGRTSYKAVSEKQLLNKVKPLFKKHRLIIFPVDGNAKETVSTYEKSYKGDTETKLRAVTELKVTYRIVDIDSGQSIDVVGFGNGADPQDKGAGKAFTYSYKAALQKTFMLFSGEDTDNTHSDNLDDDYDTGESERDFAETKEELLLAFEALVGKTGSRAKAHEALGTTSDWMKDIVNKKNVAEMKKLSSLISGKVDSL